MKSLCSDQSVGQSFQTMLKSHTVSAFPLMEKYSCSTELTSEITAEYFFYDNFQILFKTADIGLLLSSIVPKVCLLVISQRKSAQQF